MAPDVISRARASHSAAEEIVDRASTLLGETRASRYFDPRGVTLQSNRDIQITVFLATQMYLAALRAEGVHAVGSMGLSLGEYSHLVHIEAIDFEEALRLVDERGRCYDDSPPGMMATVLAVDRETVGAVVEQARAHGPIVISNINTPTQHVLAGVEPAVAWASAMLEDEHAAHVTIIERRVPMHSPIMAPVAAAFVPALTRVPWKAPAKAYWPNVTASPLRAPTATDFVAHLTRHVSEPVLWQQSIDSIAASHPDAAFLEVGPGGVLHNMMRRGWRALRSARIDAPDGIESRTHFAATVGALRA